MRFLIFAASLLWAGIAIAQWASPPIPVAGSTAKESSHVFCTRACVVLAIYPGTCPAGDYVDLYDAATAPADGSSDFPANFFSVGGSASGYPVRTGTGASVVCSSTAPPTQTTVTNTLFYGQITQ